MDALNGQAELLPWAWLRGGAHAIKINGPVTHQHAQRMTRIEKRLVISYTAALRLVGV